MRVEPARFSELDGQRAQVMNLASSFLYDGENRTIDLPKEHMVVDQDGWRHRDARSWSILSVELGSVFIGIVSTSTHPQAEQ